jgi:Fe-S oxidoreductase
LIFNDTFTNFFEPAIGAAAVKVFEATGSQVGLAPNVCCGRPLISKGLLRQARELAAKNAENLYPLAEHGEKVVFLEPSCLSAIKEDAPALLRGEQQRKALVVAKACALFEECDFSAAPIAAGPHRVLLHGHCHQKAMGLLPPAKALLDLIPDAKVVDLEAGCCGMAGSFGYAREHYEVSRAIGERRLFPAVREMESGDVLVASGTSCRHQVEHFTERKAIHPAVLLAELLKIRRDLI